MGLDRLQGQHRYAVESRQLANQRRRREDEEDRISYGFTVVRAGGDGVRLQTPGGGSLSADSTSNGAFIEGATIPTEIGKGQSAIGRSNCCNRNRRRRYYSDDAGAFGEVIAIFISED